MPGKKITAQLIENRLIVWEPGLGSQLYKLGYYGKPLGIAKPKTFEFQVPLLLDLMEGLYLQEKGLIQVFENGKRINRRELARMAGETHRDFQLKYMVYRDLRENGLIVQPGIKFGCDFAVYQQGPGIDHAPFLIQVKKPQEDIDAVEIVRAGRLATTVRKRFIIAVPNLKTKTIRYLMFKWWKA
ncbi:tRNA-intron lyase [Candidatus Hecatella orcuttiae]|jgi:tRNA-intron endonuclease|uniref:tRNA-intron lyase n=1 Tax=Candidatus Hecatella orcuttiae TaxID=1935119 RepID=UPI002867DB44|nr:tRNA-intron lyase [Candidatus Hecatella orcuttiae]